MDISDLQNKTLEELRAVARNWEIPSYSRLKKDDLMVRLLRVNAEKQGLELRGGVLEIVEDGIGFLRAETVNGLDPETAKRRPAFESLTPIFPDTRFNLETVKNVLSTRFLNLIAPVGRGQRGLIVSPPKAGKTTVLKDIANA